ncbi:MAG: MFS transporter [Chloroflexi bacterium]|nr:MFS transporter [Chloroflexota bacterium]
MTSLLDDNRRWLVFGTLFLAAGVNVGSSNYAFGLFVEPLETTFGWSRTAISASLSFTAVGSLASPVIGRLMDRHGARPVMVISLALMGISFLVRPAMTELWHWYGLSFFQFIGISGITALPTGRLIAIWFPNSQGRIMGITVAGINFGGITIPFIVNVALGASGWQAAYVAMGVVAMTLAGLALLFIREHPREAHDSKLGPAQGETSRLSGLSLSSATKTRSFYAIVGALALGNFAHAGVFPQLVPHFTELGVPYTLAALTVTVMAVTGLVSKPTFGYLSERMTARRAMILTLSGQGVGSVLLVISPVSAWVGLPIFGVSMGAHSALMPLLVQESFGTRNFGSIMGTVTMFSLIPFGIAPLLAGRTFDVTQSYTLAYLGFAALFVIAAAGLTQMRIQEERWSQVNSQ